MCSNISVVMAEKKGMCDIYKFHSQYTRPAVQVDSVRKLSSSVLNISVAPLWQKNGHIQEKKSCFYGYKLSKSVKKLKVFMLDRPSF